MANIIIKQDGIKQHEAYVMKEFGVTGNGNASQREAAECIAAKTREAYQIAKKMEGKR